MSRFTTGPGCPPVECSGQEADGGESQRARGSQALLEEAEDFLSDLCTIMSLVSLSDVYH